MTRRAKPQEEPPVTEDVARIVRPVSVVCWSVASAACILLASITLAGMALALAWHTLRWSFGQPAQFVVLVLVLLLGVILHRIDRHARDEAEAP